MSGEAGKKSTQGQDNAPAIFQYFKVSSSEGLKLFKVSRFQVLQGFKISRIPMFPSFSIFQHSKFIFQKCQIQDVNVSRLQYISSLPWIFCFSVSRFKIFKMLSSVLKKM